VDIPKFATTLRTIMDEHQVKNPENHFFIFERGFVFKKSAFSQDDVSKMERVLRYAATGSSRKERLIYSPFNF